MIEFPKSAVYGEKIAFTKLKQRGLPACYSETMRSLVWAYKLSPATLNLAATKSVREIEVMDLTLKAKCSTFRALAMLIAAIDKLIPSPLIFRVFEEEGRYRGIALNLKQSGGALYGNSDVYRLFYSEKDIELPRGCADLESFYRNLATLVAELETSPVETLEDLNKRHYQLEALQAAWREAEVKLARERQLNRKYELAKEQQRLEKEIEQCRNLRK